MIFGLKTSIIILAFYASKQICGMTAWRGSLEPQKRKDSKMEKTKRILSFFIALLMILTIIPMNAIVLALEADDSAETQTQDSSEKEPVKDPVENADLKTK